MAGKSYKDLEIYQLSHRLGVDIHHFSLKLPKFELYETGSQLRRSSKSVTANIVEEYGRRRYKAEFIRFLVFSHSSCNEAIEWLEYIKDCHTQMQSQAEPLIDQLNLLGGKINRFIQAVESRHQAS